MRAFRSQLVSRELSQRMLVAERMNHVSIETFKAPLNSRDRPGRVASRCWTPTIMCLGLWSGCPKLPACQMASSFSRTATLLMSTSAESSRSVGNVVDQHHLFGRRLSQRWVRVSGIVMGTNVVIYSGQANSLYVPAWNRCNRHFDAHKSVPIDRNPWNWRWFQQLRRLRRPRPIGSEWLVIVTIRHFYRAGLDCERRSSGCCRTDKFQ